MIPFAGHHRRRDRRLPPDTTLYLLVIILLVLAVIIAALLWGGTDRGPAPPERPGAAEMAPQEPAGCNPLADPACAMVDLQRLRVAPEHRCTPYNRDDYQYSQSVEDHIIAGLGGVYGPYTGRWFRSKYDTDIEHMVAVSEAHDSGLCAADGRTRRVFAGDPLNLTLASPAVNRDRKKHYDAAEWMPERNRCWFAGRVIAVRKKYGLTIDRAERAALASVLRGCVSLVLRIY